MALRQRHRFRATSVRARSGQGNAMEWRRLVRGLHGRRWPQLWRLTSVLRWREQRCSAGADLRLRHWSRLGKNWMRRRTRRLPPKPHSKRLSLQ